MSAETEPQPHTESGDSSPCHSKEEDEKQDGSSESLKVPETKTNGTKPPAYDRRTSQVVSLQEDFDEWDTLQKEFRDLENLHKDYIKKVTELQKIQGQCNKAITHQRYRMKQIKDHLKRAAKNGIGEGDDKHADEILNQMPAKKEQLVDMEEFLPKKNGLYLKIILGSVDVTFVNQSDRFQYKDEYERFKFIVTVIILILSFLNIVVSYRAVDSILHFLLVWYHCTLTIRESILVVNGSRIKGWWRSNHFITTVQAGLIIVWPDGDMYHEFRKLFMWYTCYISFLQFLQCNYQQGALYRLRTLGERHKMDITIQGFHSWMWRGLSFLLPFLYFGYLFQLYLAYILYNLSFLPECDEWQVPVLAVILFLLFFGNTLTTTMVIHSKVREKLKLREVLVRKSRVFQSSAKKSQ